MLVSVWTPSDSLLIWRPTTTPSSDIQDGKDQNFRILNPGPLSSRPHQLTTERGCHFKFTVLTEPMARRASSISALLQGLATADTDVADRGRLLRTAPASRTQWVSSKLLIFLIVAGVPATFCSRSYHPNRCDFVAAFLRRTALAAAMVCLP